MGDVLVGLFKIAKSPRSVYELDNTTKWSLVYSRWNIESRFDKKCNKTIHWGCFIFSNFPPRCKIRFVRADYFFVSIVREIPPNLSYQLLKHVWKKNNLLSYIPYQLLSWVFYCQINILFDIFFSSISFYIFFRLYYILFHQNKLKKIQIARLSRSGLGEPNKYLLGEKTLFCHLIW